MLFSLGAREKKDREWEKERTGRVKHNATQAAGFENASSESLHK